MNKVVLWVLLIVGIPLCSQTYVWKGGKVLIENPDSLTFQKPDTGLQLTDSFLEASVIRYKFIYLTSDWQGKPCWMSAVLYLTVDQQKSKRIDKMALYNRYTITQSDEAPSEGKFDLQIAGLMAGCAVVACDGEGFGETDDRTQTYCLAEANAKTSVDAILAARDWLMKQNYTLSEEIYNYGYSQGAQTTLAALKLSQTEYRNRIQFKKTIAGDGPYDMRLTYRKCIEWKRISLSSVLPMTIITLNELYKLGLSYSDIFVGALASHVKSWFISKKFNSSELDDLIGSDSLKYYMAPALLDSTSDLAQRILSCADSQNFWNNWEPDEETDVVIVHSLSDDVVPSDNSQELYDWFVSKGVKNVVFDKSTLTSTHSGSSTAFATLCMSLMNQ